MQINTEISLIPIERDNRIDSIRGLFLILMVIDHYGGWIASYTYEGLGYISSAEGFVFISGFVFALVYSRYTVDYSLLTKKVIYRAYTVYKYHFLLIFGLPFVMYFAPLYIKYWKYMPSYFSTENTTLLKSITSSFLMLNQPYYMDVLPLYAIFILLCWPMLVLLTEKKAFIVLSISFGLWALSQFFNPVSLLSTEFFPNAYPGDFNVLSWQVLFLLGTYFGFMKRTNNRVKLLNNRLIIILAIIIFLICFIDKHKFISIGLGYTAFIDKTNLGPLRLLNFLSLALITSAVMKHIPLKSKIPWIHFIGKHSLYVFAFHILVIYLFLLPFNLGDGIYNRFGSNIYCICLVAFLASLSIPAYLHKVYMKKQKKY